MKTTIYIDCKGNVENDKYLNEENIEEFKIFLTKIGYDNIEVKKHEMSWKNNRTFIEKPRVMKIKSGGEIDWCNSEVVTHFILSDEKTNEELLQDVIKISGRVSVDTFKTTPMAVIMKYESIVKSYRLWKERNNIIETPENKKDLANQYSKIWVRKKRERRKSKLKVGTSVYIKSKRICDIVEAYDDEEQLYVVGGEKYDIIDLQKEEDRLKIKERISKSEEERKNLNNSISRYDNNLDKESTEEDYERWINGAERVEGEIEELKGTLEEK